MAFMGVRLRAQNGGRSPLGLGAAESLGWLIVAAVGVASLTWPFGWDQGIFASVGRVVAEGGLPYRDAWDIKGPVTHYVYAVAHLLFGPVAWGIRVLDIALMGLVAIGLQYLVRTIGIDRGGRFVVIAFILWYASGTYWNTAQPDAWAGGLIVGSMTLALVPANLTARRAFGAGALIGVATAIKPHYAIFLILPLVTVRFAVHDRLRHAGAVVAGFATVAFGVVAWFALHGALQEFVFAYVTWPATAYSGLDQLSPATIVAQLRDYLFPASVLLIGTPAIAAGTWSMRTSANHRGAIVVLWGALALFAVAIQRRFFDYHWTLAMPPLVLLGALGIRDRIRASAGSRSARLLVYSYTILLAARLVVHPVFEVGHLAARVLGMQSSDQYERHFGIGGVDLQVARMIAERTRMSDQVIVFGPNADVGYLSGRASPSRFMWNTPLLIGASRPEFDAFRAEYLRDLRTQAPTYFVESTETGSVVPNYPGLGAFPELARLISDEYTLEVTIEHLNVYRRKPR
jgi:hypothetical protein